MRRAPARGVPACSRPERCGAAGIFREALLDTNDAAADCLRDGGGAVVHVQLGVEVLHVHTGSIRTDAERGANLLVAHPLGHELEDLALARAEGWLPRMLVESLLNFCRDDATTGVHFSDDV